MSQRRHKEVNSIPCTKQKKPENAKTITFKIKFIDSERFKLSKSGR